MNQLKANACTGFLSLSREEQMDQLQSEGIYIGKLNAGESTTLLYQYQTIYVEVVYTVHRTHVESVHCFTDTAILDRYLSSSGFDTHEPV